MAISTAYETLSDVHDGVNATYVALTKPSVVLAGEYDSSVFPTGAALDAADGGFNVSSGGAALTRSATAPSNVATFPTDPASGKYSWNWTTSGCTILATTTGYTVESILGDTASVTFLVKSNDAGSIVSTTLVASIALARAGATGEAAQNAKLINLIGDRQAFLVNRATDGVLTWHATDGIENITLNAMKQNVGTGSIAWEYKLGDSTTWVSLTDDNGAGTYKGGDIDGNSLVIKKENFADLSNQSYNNVVTIRASLTFDSVFYSDVWDLLLDENAADGLDGIDGADAYLADIMIISGNLSFRNSIGSGTLKAVLLQGGTITPDFGVASTLINSYLWKYTLNGVTTSLDNAQKETLTGTTANNSVGGSTGLFDHHTLVVDADGSVLGGGGAGGEVTWSCEIDYDPAT